MFIIFGFPKHLQVKSITLVSEPSLLQITKRHRLKHWNFSCNRIQLMWHCIWGNTYLLRQYSIKHRGQRLVGLKWGPIGTEYHICYTLDVGGLSLHCKVSSINIVMKIWCMRNSPSEDQIQNNIIADLRSTKISN